MSKYYQLRFGSGNPTSFSGLSPTFTMFENVPSGTPVTPPGITELPTSTGLYYFNYAATLPIAFVIDGGAALASGDRYIVDQLDPIQSVDQKVGMDFDSYGSTLGPTTLIGFAKRNQQFEEGDATFNKTTGKWDLYAQGTSTLLVEKTLTDSSGIVTKV